MVVDGARKLLRVSDIEYVDGGDLCAVQFKVGGDSTYVPAGSADVGGSLNNTADLLVFEIEIQANAEQNRTCREMSDHLRQEALEVNGMWAGAVEPPVTFDAAAAMSAVGVSGCQDGFLPNADNPGWRMRSGTIVEKLAVSIDAGLE